MFHIISIILFSVPALISRRFGRLITNETSYHHTVVRDIYLKKLAIAQVRHSAINIFGFPSDISDHEIHREAEHQTLQELDLQKTQKEFRELTFMKEYFAALSEKNVMQRVAYVITTLYKYVTKRRTFLIKKHPSLHAGGC